MKSNEHQLEPVKCSVIVDCLAIPVPESIARTYFVSKLHAGLLPADVLPDPMRIFTDASADKSAPCYKTDAALLDKQRTIGVQQGDRIFSERVKYSFPVFDAKYLMAAIVKIHLVAQIPVVGSKLLDGLEFTETVEIFRKRKGFWVLVGTEMVGQT